MSFWWVQVVHPILKAKKLAFGPLTSAPSHSQQMRNGPVVHSSLWQSGWWYRQRGHPGRQLDCEEGLA